MLGLSDGRADRIAVRSVDISPIDIEPHVAVDALQFDGRLETVHGYREMLLPPSLQDGIARHGVGAEVPIIGLGDGPPSEEYVTVARWIRRFGNVSARQYALDRVIALPLVGAERYVVVDGLGFRVGIDRCGILLPYRIQGPVPEHLVILGTQIGAVLRLGPSDERVSVADHAQLGRQLHVCSGFDLLRIDGTLPAVCVVCNREKSGPVLDEIRLHIGRTLGFDRQSRSVCDVLVLHRTPSDERVSVLGDPAVLQSDGRSVVYDVSLDVGERSSVEGIYEDVRVGYPFGFDGSVERYRVEASQSVDGPAAPSVGYLPTYEGVSALGDLGSVAVGVVGKDDGGSYRSLDGIDRSGSAVHVEYERRLLVGRNGYDDVPSHEKVVGIAVASADHALGLDGDIDGVDPVPRRGTRERELPLAGYAQCEPVGRYGCVLVGRLG